jgi:hypothetical protein
MFTTRVNKFPAVLIICSARLSALFSATSNARPARTEHRTTYSNLHAVQYGSEANEVAGVLLTIALSVDATFIHHSSNTETVLSGFSKLAVAASDCCACNELWQRSMQRLTALLLLRQTLVR